MNRQGVNQFSPTRHSPGVIFTSWLGVILSGLLLLPAGAIVRNVAASFRPCSINNSGLALNACGKHSVAPTDLLLLAIFIGAVILFLTTLTHAIRVSRRRR